MIHIDLFSGIGGFALAVDAVWDNVEHIFCEIDPYCQALLKKRFEGGDIYGDIRELITDTDRTGVRTSEGETNQDGQKANERRKEQPQPKLGGQGCFIPTADTEGGQSRFKETGNGGQDISRGSQECFILTGGFPCQPFSQAGKRKGTADNRYLWPEMLRVIQLTKPEWVVAENVRGILTINKGMVFEQVCLDLEGEGYEVQPLIIPAVAKNAPHRRDRVWIVANRKCGEVGNEHRLPCNERGRTSKVGRESIQHEDRQAQTMECGQGGSNAPDTEKPRGERRGTGKRGENWNQNWLEVATRFCGMDARFSERVDRPELSAARHRVERLKALGNAIVPQVAIEIMRGIAKT